MELASWRKRGHRPVDSGTLRAATNKRILWRVETPVYSIQLWSVPPTRYVATAGSSGSPRDGQAGRGRGEKQRGESKQTAQ